MAVGMEHCDMVANFSSGYQGWFNYNTGTILLKPTAAGRRFVASWMGFQKRHLLEWGPQDFNKSDGNQRRSDQARSLFELNAGWRSSAATIAAASHAACTTTSMHRRAGALPTAGWHT